MVADSISKFASRRSLQVSAREAMELRDAILQAGDLRQPVNFNEQLMKNSQTVLDNEVSQSLIQLLSSKRPSKVAKAGAGVESVSTR